MCRGWDSQSHLMWELNSSQSALHSLAEQNTWCFSICFEFALSVAQGEEREQRWELAEASIVASSLWIEVIL